MTYEASRFKNVTRLEGVVQYFDRERGYGIIDACTKCFFVHRSAIECEGKVLAEGDVVTFEPHPSVKTERFPCDDAIHVRKSDERKEVSNE